MYFRILISCFLLFLAVIPAKSQSMGCTNIAAINYNPLATINDGSCIYADTSILPDNSFELNSILRETSGLILWNNRLWTFNDNDDVTLYSLDTINGEILDSIELTGTENRDWEAISQDDAFIYLGDFGNNEHGNRSDLKIYKISKSSLLIGSPEIEIISFNYPEQTSLEPTSNNQTDYDCEAMIVKDEAIYLFTKQWISSGTSIYSIPIIAGNYAAELIGEYPIAGLVTDATFIPEKSIVMLCGYNTVLQPFIYLLYDINSDDFFGANKRRIQLSLPFHQIEGIASSEGDKIYLSNERFAHNPLINIDAKLHAINLNSILGN